MMRLLAITTICYAFVACQVAAQDSDMMEQMMKWLQLQQQIQQMQQLMGATNQNPNANTDTQYPLNPSFFNLPQTAPNPYAPNTHNQYQPPPPSNQNQYSPPPPFNQNHYQPLPPSNQNQHQPPPPSNQNQHQPPPPSNQNQHQPTPPSNQNQYQPTPASNTWSYNTAYQPQGSTYDVTNTENQPAPLNPNLNNFAPNQNNQGLNPPRTVVQQPTPAPNPAPNNPGLNVVNTYEDVNLKTPNSCVQFTQDRVYCSGNNKASCEASGCCWDPAQVDQLTCFYHPGMANLPASTAPPLPPPSEWPTVLPSSFFVSPSAGVPERIGEPSQVYFTHGCLLHCTSVRRADRSVCIPNVSRSVCTQEGCCFDESEPDISKRCFYSNYIKDVCPLKEECKLPHSPAEACGTPQISQLECEAMGCCHNAISGVTKCYKKQYRDQRPPTPTPTPKVETTTKFNLLQKLQELEAEMKGEEPHTTSQPPGRPTVEPYEVAPKAGGFASNGERETPSQAPPTSRQVYSSPPTSPVQYRQQCVSGRCSLVAITPPTCIPRKCGDPVYTPNKVKNDFDPRKIVGGSRAFPFSHPWTVMIQKSEGNRTFICGATLICQQWILTAAHCLDQQTKYKSTPDVDPNMYKIFLGRWTGWQSTHGQQVQVFKGVQDIEFMLQHENFIPGKHRGVITHDIALIKLRKIVKLDDFVQPACLPNEPPKPGTVMFATGWGVSKNEGPAATTMKQVGVQIKTQQACKDRVPGFQNPPGVICGGGEPNHDTCIGDSGGPLVGSKKQSSAFGTSAKSLWYLHGLTSIGSPSCNTNQFDRQPALYTDVFYFLNWIKIHTKNCCR